MRTCDVLIVGGGPGGSACARVLSAAGMDVVVLDRARFPRDKLCAGWVTPATFTALQLAPSEYAASGAILQEIRGFTIGLVGGRGIQARYDEIVSYGVRRCEFDTFLLRRSGARVEEGTALASLRRVAGEWIGNEEIRAAALVGAGGHFCPVAAHLGRHSAPRALVVAKEKEFRLRHPDRSPIDGESPELFFCHDLDGYGWCVRKGDYLNVGIGRRAREGFTAHVRTFHEFLAATGRIDCDAPDAWRGHAYILAGGATRPPVDDGVVLVGDAAGLAVPESGEGIRTAIESGTAAAEVLLAANGRYTLDALQPYADRVRGPAVSNGAAARLLNLVPSPLVRAAGRQLLRSRLFTRHVVMDRWFLRRNTAAPRPVREQPHRVLADKRL